MTDLHAELASVTIQLQEKEAQLASLANSLQEKDRIIIGMKDALDMTRGRLSEAGGVVRRIAELSAELAEAAAGGSQVEENSVLTQTNYELFTANRTLLERERELHKYQVRIQTFFPFFPPIFAKPWENSTICKNSIIFRKRKQNMRQKSRKLPASWQN